MKRFSLLVAGAILSATSACTSTATPASSLNPSPQVDTTTTPTSTNAPTATAAVPATATAATGLPEVAVNPPSGGELAISTHGKGSRSLRVTPTRSTKHVYFNVVCDSGSFSLKNGNRLIFRGDCDSRLGYQADAPVDYVRDAVLAWTVPPSTNWRIAAWNH